MLIGFVGASASVLGIADWKRNVLRVRRHRGVRSRPFGKYAVKVSGVMPFIQPAALPAACGSGCHRFARVTPHKTMNYSISRTIW